MKSILTSFLLLITILSFSQATSGGPDNFGYTYKSSNNPTGPSFQWFEISQIGTIITGLTDDNFVGPYSISGFPFYSGNPTNLYIGSNGYISFAPANIASTNAQFPIIPQTSGANHFIAPLLTDLSFAGTGNPGSCYFYNQGDTICITFEKAPFWINNTSQYGGENTFQIILNKRDSSITINYIKQVGLPDPTYTTNFLSIGIENSTGNDGLQYYRGTTFPTDSTSIRFEYPNIIQSITDVAVDYIDNPGNGAKFLALNGAFTPTASVKNNGNQNINSSITVSTRIIDPSGLTAFSATQSIDSLQPADDSTKSFGNFTPNVAGKFIVRTFVSRISGDAAVTNDTSEFLLKVVDTTQSPIVLDYTDGLSGAGIGWSGGNGGCGVYIEPPYYPARIVAANYYITTTGATASGFHSIIVDDNGRQAGQGTVLDSTFIAANTIAIGAYNRVPLTTPIVVNSGGIYLYWLMDGATVNLGRSFSSPASRQTYEIIFGSWSEYRDKLTQDFLMNIEITPLATDLENVSLSSIGNLYPNPANENIRVELKQPSNSIIEVLDVNGKKVDAKVIRYTKYLEIIRSNQNSGTYFLRIGNETKAFVWVD
tara:strand:- start:691 stop:2481 length:1791 start_codon:yes stop_codon:yes gene_type:complete